MPLGIFHVQEGALSDKSVCEVVGELTAALLVMHGADAESTVVGPACRFEVHEYRSHHIFVGGKPNIELPVYRFEIWTPVGAMDLLKRTAFYNLATDAVLKAEGVDVGDPEHRFRVWCVVNDIPEAYWGCGGKPYSRHAITQWARRQEIRQMRAADGRKQSRPRRAGADLGELVSCD